MGAHFTNFCIPFLFFKWLVVEFSPFVELFPAGVFNRGSKTEVLEALGWTVSASSAWLYWMHWF